MTLQWLRSSVLVGAGVCAGIVSTSGTAQEPPAGNPQKGKQISYPCLGCHGVDGYKNAYPNYSVPELEGEHPEYILPALTESRDGDRAPLPMHSQASSLTDQDIANVAAYFAGKPLTADAKPVGEVPEPAK